MISMSSSQAGSVWLVSGPVDQGLRLFVLHGSLLSAKREADFYRNRPGITIEELPVKTITGYDGGFLNPLNFGDIK